MSIVIRIDHHHYIHHEPTESATRKLDQILAQGDAMSAATAKIAAEVAETKGIMQSAAALIAKLAQEIRDNKEDPAALDALADSLDADSKPLAEAVAANTEPPTAPVV